jgi:hypothetical protein
MQKHGYSLTGAIRCDAIMLHFDWSITLHPACVLQADASPSIIANISARVGSIGDNKAGGWYVRLVYGGGALFADVFVNRHRRTHACKHVAGSGKGKLVSEWDILLKDSSLHTVNST